MPAPPMPTPTQLGDLPVCHQAVIPEPYRDEMGHMNVMWYTHLFDRATFAMMRRVGLDEDYFHSRQAGMFALAQHTRYLAEVLAGQAVTLRVRLLGRSEKRLHFLEFLSIDTGEVLSATNEAYATHVDLRVRRSAPFPADIAHRIDAVVAAHQALPWPPPVCGVLSA